MCTMIYINRGEKEIGTPAQFKKHFGIEPVKDKHYKTVDPDTCLCQIDIEASLEKAKVLYKVDYGDYYVGLLEQIGGE